MTASLVLGDETLAQAELADRAARVASGFHALGVREDDCVAALLRNDFPFFEAALGASRLGAYFVPINWHFRPEEAAYVIADCGAKVLVVHADLLPIVRAHLPEGVILLVAETPPALAEAYRVAPEACGAPAGLPTWTAWRDGHEPWSQPQPAARANMIYTSGTTGKPKGVKRAPAPPEMAARMQGLMATAFGLRPGEARRTIITGPVYHAAPNMYALVATQVGGLVLLQPKFDPEALLAQIEEHRITHLHMVPTMFVRLLNLPDEVRSRFDLSSLRFVVHAAAPCAPSVKRRMIDWWGPVIHEYYGGTETGGCVFHGSEEALLKPGTVGRAMDGCEVRILRPDGSAAEVGEPGEVFLRSSNFPDFTYHNRPGHREEVDRDGFVTIGDIGYLDGDGYLFLCDRVRDMVISGGVNIYPAEIEAELIGMAGVRDCAVFGVPDEEFGEALCAIVEPAPGISLSAEAVKAYLRSRLAGYKTPKVVEFRGELPREDSGKIFKRLLREPYWAETGRRI